MRARAHVRLHAPSIVVLLFTVACTTDGPPPWLASASITLLAGAVIVAAVELSHRYARRHCWRRRR